MSKKRFVQAVMARSLPSPDKRGAALAYAEALWHWLTAQGYGDNVDSPAGRDSKNWHQALEPTARRFFDVFWEAFGHKQGKQKAAQRWAQLGVLTDAQYQAIIAAATKEARRERDPGQVRKMAEGWLFERRWEDFEPAKTAVKAEKNHVLSRLLAELEGLKRLYQQSGDPALQPQVDKLERAVQAAREGND